MLRQAAATNAEPVRVGGELSREARMRRDKILTRLRG
jgi:hypothetical protein